MKKIVIVGATSAIAEAVAREYAMQGCHLLITGRNEQKLDVIAADLKVRGALAVDKVQFELANVASFDGLVSQAFELLTSVDIVLLAPGTLPDQIECENNSQALLEALSINGVNTVLLMQAFANRLIAQGAGTLAVISSPAGDRGRQSNYVYGAAKGAVSIFSQGLRNAAFKKGVHVLTIKPGFVDTPMTASFDKSGPLWAKPETVAKDIVRAINKRKNIAYTPWFWWGIMTIIKNIPESIFKRLSL